MNTPNSRLTSVDPGSTQAFFRITEAHQDRLTVVVYCAAPAEVTVRIVNSATGDEIKSESRSCEPSSFDAEAFTFKPGAAAGGGVRVVVSVGDGERSCVVPLDGGVSTSIRTRFGVWSCHDPFRGLDGDEAANLEVWAALADELKPSEGVVTFGIAAGDQVYTDAQPLGWGRRRRGASADARWHGDLPSWIRRHLRRAPDKAGALRERFERVYARHWQFEAVRRVFASLPTYMMWDDHDIFDGYGSHRPRSLKRVVGGDENAKAAYAAAREAFLRFQAPPADEARRHDPAAPLDYTFERGGCSFFVMDGRTCRTRDNGSSNVLGAEQLARLNRWTRDLAEDTAAGVFCVVSAVPVVHLRRLVPSAGFRRRLARLVGYDDDLHDEWDHDENVEECLSWLEPLFEASSRTNRPVLVLSGDVHASAVFRLRHEGYPRANVWQITSSAIAQPNLPEDLLDAVVGRRGRLVHRDSGMVTYERYSAPIVLNNAAIIEFSDDTRTLQVAYRVRMPDGRCVATPPLVLQGPRGPAPAPIERRLSLVTEPAARDVARRLVETVCNPWGSGLPQTVLDESRGARISAGAVDLRGLVMFGLTLSELDLSDAHVRVGDLAGTDLTDSLLPPDCSFSGLDSSAKHELSSLNRFAAGLVSLSVAVWFALETLPAAARIDPDTPVVLPGVDTRVPVAAVLPLVAVALGAAVLYLATRFYSTLESLAAVPMRSPDGRTVAQRVEATTVGRAVAGLWTRAITHDSSARSWLDLGIVLLTCGAPTAAACSTLTLASTMAYTGTWGWVWQGTIAAGFAVLLASVAFVGLLATDPLYPLRGRWDVARRLATRARPSPIARPLRSTNAQLTPGQLRQRFTGLIVLTGVLFSAAFMHTARNRAYYGEWEFPVSLVMADANGLELGRGEDTVIRGLDARGARLDDAVFNGLELIDPDFTNASLQRASFIGATICGGTFEGANLSRATFAGARLIPLHEGTCVEGLSTDVGAPPSAAPASDELLALDGPTLMYAKLDQADLSGSLLRGADLRRASLTEARCDDMTLTNSVFTHADFTGIQARNMLIDASVGGNSTWTGALMPHARWIRSDLPDSDFTAVHAPGILMDSVNVVRSTFHGSVLARSEAIHQSTHHTPALIDVHASHANFSEAELVGITVTHSDFSGASFRGASAWRAAFGNSNLSRTEWQDARVNRMRLFCVRHHEAEALDGIGYARQPAEAEGTTASAETPAYRDELAIISFARANVGPTMDPSDLRFTGVDLNRRRSYDRWCALATE